MAVEHVYDTGGVTHKGGKETNSDLFHAGPKMITVIDGGGREDKGIAAAHEVLSLFREYERDAIEKPVQLKALFRAAHALLKFNDEGVASAAATVFKGNTAHVINVGHTAVFLWRKGKLNRLTPDHSLGAAFRAVGLSLRKGSNIAEISTTALGSEMPKKLKLVKVRLRAGDRLILATNGLGNLPMPGIADVLSNQRSSDSKATAKALVETSEAARNELRGKIHNTTVIVADYLGKRR